MGYLLYEKPTLEKDDLILYSLAMIDNSFIESHKFMELDPSAQFLESNCHNLKLMMIGDSFVNLLYKTRIYFQTMNFDAD